MKTYTSGETNQTLNASQRPLGLTAPTLPLAAAMNPITRMCVERRSGRIWSAKALDVRQRRAAVADSEVNARHERVHARGLNANESDLARRRALRHQTTRELKQRLFFAGAAPFRIDSCTEKGQLVDLLLGGKAVDGGGGTRSQVLPSGRVVRRLR